MAVTGKGARISSTWGSFTLASGSMRQHSTRKGIFPSNSDQAMQAAMQDWMFEAPVVAGGQPTMRRWGAVPHMGTTRPGLGGIR